MRPHFTGGRDRKKAAPDSPSPPKAAVPPRRAGAGPGRPVGPPRYQYKEGFPIGTVLLGVIAALLGIFAIMLFLPKDLSHIQGYGAMTEPFKRNLYMEALPALLQQEAGKSFTEAEINGYLKERVQGAQRGSFDSMVKFRGVYVDIEPGEVEIFLERSVFGFRHTMSIRMVKSRYMDQLIWESAGGSVGKFSLSTQQFGPVVTAFKRLGVACDEEIRILTGMRDVLVEKDKITLVP